MSPGTSAETLSPRFVFALSMIDTVLLLTLIIVLLVRRGERPLEVFFGHRSKVGEVAFGIFSLPFVLAIVVTLMVIIMRIAPELNNVPKNPLENFLATPAIGGKRDEHLDGFPGADVGEGGHGLLPDTPIRSGTREPCHRRHRLLRVGRGPVPHGLERVQLAFRIAHRIAVQDLEQRLEPRRVVRRRPPQRA